MAKFIGFSSIEEANSIFRFLEKSIGASNQFLEKARNMLIDLRMNDLRCEVRNLHNEIQLRKDDLAALEQAVRTKSEESEAYIRLKSEQPDPSYSSGMHGDGDQHYSPVVDKVGVMLNRSLDENGSSVGSKDGGTVPVHSGDKCQPVSPAKAPDVRQHTEQGRTIEKGSGAKLESAGSAQVEKGGGTYSHRVGKEMASAQEGEAIEGDTGLTRRSDRAGFGFS